MAKTQNSQNVISFVKRRKTNLIKVFHSQCCICGFNAFQEALEFHHVDPSQKEFGITDGGTVTKALSKQLDEMRKCVLVCANCHRGIHAGYLKVPDNPEQFFDDEIANQLLQELDEIKHGQKHYCQRCGKEIVTASANYCADCAKFVSRKVDRPSREELKELVRSTPFTRIADQFSVSDNTIRKWCDSYGLPRKSTEIKRMSDQEWEKV